MSEYWIEIHPEQPTYIIVSEDILKILKNAKFPEQLDIQILLIGKKITVIFYKLGYENDPKARLIGNKITNIDYIGISKVYKSVQKIFVTFEQRDTYQQTNIDFDVFVIDFTTDVDEPAKEESNDLDDVFK